MGLLFAARALGQAVYEALELVNPSEPAAPLHVTHLNNAGQIAGSFNAPGGRLFIARWEPGKSELTDFKVFRPADFEAPPGVTLGGLRWEALHDTGEGYAVQVGQRRFDPPVRHPVTRRQHVAKAFTRVLHFSAGAFQIIREFESWGRSGLVLSSGPGKVRILECQYGGDDTFGRAPVDESGFSWLPEEPHHPEVWVMEDLSGGSTVLPTSREVLSDPGDYRFLSAFRHMDDAGVMYGEATFLTHPLTSFGRSSRVRQEVWVNGVPRRFGDYAGAAAGAIVISGVNRDGEVTGIFGGAGSTNVALSLPRANYGRGAGAHTITTSNDARAVSRVNRQGAMVWSKDDSVPGRSVLNGQLWSAGVNTPLSSLVAPGLIRHPLTGRGAFVAGSALLNDRGWIMTSSRNPDLTGPPEVQNWLLRPVADAEAILSANRMSVGETVTFTLRVRNLTPVPRTLGLPIGFRFTGTAQFQLDGSATPPGPRVVPAFGTFEIQQRIRATNPGTSTWYSQGRLIGPSNTIDTAPAYTGSLRVVDRADLLIKREDEPESAYAANDEYLPVPEGRQSRANSVQRGEACVFHVRVQNDDTRPRTFRLKAAESGPTEGWEIAHELDGLDVSGAVRATTGHVLPELAAGASRLVVLRVRPTTALNDQSRRVVYTLEDSAEQGETRDSVDVQITALSDIVVSSPAAEELVPQGKPYAVRFRAREGVEFLDFYSVAPPNGPRTVVARNVAVAAGSFVWQVPPDLESPAVQLVAVNAAAAGQEGVSEVFRVRDPWRWHRVMGPGNAPRYEKMLLADHAWSFPQSPENVWNETYWDQPAHHYCCGARTGEDLFIGAGVKYNPAFFDRPGVVTGGWPSWPAWVRGFGIGATYQSRQALDFAGLRLNQPHLPAFEEWYAESKGYEGICYGLSLAVMAAFQDPDRFDAFWSLGQPSARLGAISKTNARALDAGHALQLHTLGSTFAAERWAQRARRPSEVVEALKRLFESDDRTGDRFLWFTGTLPNEAGEGPRQVASHAVVPVGMVALEPPTRYAIGIYDPNAGGGVTQHLIVDTTNESWSHSDPLWEGDQGKGLFLSDLVTEAFELVTPTWLVPESVAARTTRGGPRGEEDTLLPIRLHGRAGAVIAAAGGVLRFENGVVTESLPGGDIEWPVTGRPSFPRAFHVPDGEDYQIEVVPDATGLTEARVGHAGHSVLIRHQSANADVRLVLRAFEQGVEVVSGAGGTIECIIHRTSADGDHRRIRVAGLAVANPAGLRFTTDGSAMVLTGPPAASTYHIELLQSGAGRQSVFHQAAIPWAAGDMHSVAPDWDALDQGPLVVGIDRDRDGRQDDSFSLRNEAPSPALWSGWSPASLQLDVRLRADGSPEFRVFPADAGTVVLEVSSNLREWLPAGDAESGSWLPVTPRIPAGQPAAGSWFLRARK